MGTRRKGSTLYVQSNLKRTTTSSSVLATMDSFGGIRFARSEGSYNSPDFFEAVKSFPMTSGDDLQLQNMAIDHSPNHRVFADSTGE